jgi:ribosomal protein L11
MFFSVISLRDFFLDKQREKAKLEAETKLMVTLRQLIPAGEAKPVPPLSVILGQYYLNLIDFCKEFNLKTNEWENGVILPTIVKKGLRAKEYKLYIASPSISSLICNGRQTLKSIQLTVVYDIVRIKAVLLKKPIRVVAAMVFSTASSVHIRKILAN